jgi:hypothetical protein
MCRQFLLCLSIIFLVSGANAGEFGNVLDKDVEQASRDASSKALDGIIKTFEAIKQRELKNVGESNKSLLAASEALRQAAAQMEKIAIDKFPSADRAIAESGVDPDQINRINQIAQLLGSSSPKTFRDLYRLFTGATYRLAQTLEAASGRSSASGQPVLRNIGPELTRYIVLGDLVSQMAQRLL